jgi:hypothetical protein
VFVFVAFPLIFIFMCACLVFSLSLLSVGFVHNGNATKNKHKLETAATKATRAAKQIPSGLKSEISYTPEDGHVGRNM